MGNRLAGSLPLAGLLLDALAGMEFAGQPFVGALAQCLLDELAGLAALAAGKAFGLDSSLALGRYDDFDGLHQAAPPTLMVSLMEPSLRACSVQLWPLRRVMWS